MAKQHQERGRAVLKFSPYTYVRTVAMRGLLFSKEDYLRMMKMCYAEIAHYLQESSYKEDITSLAMELHDADLIEAALSMNLGSTYRKLLHISPHGLRNIIRAYAKRWDIQDIKAILRGKFTGSHEKEMKRALSYAGALGQEHMHELMKQHSIEDVLKHNVVVPFTMFQDALASFSNHHTMDVIEDVFDYYYYKEIIGVAAMYKASSPFLFSFIIHEIETINIIRILRAKQGNLSTDLTEKLIIITHHPASDHLMHRLAAMPDLDNILSTLGKERYQEVVAGFNALPSTEQHMMDLENAFRRYLHRTSSHMMHHKLLSVNTILHFMLAKETEIRNLRLLIKGKQLHLGDEFILHHMVM